MKKLVVLLLLLLVIAVLSAVSGIVLSRVDGPLLGDTALEWVVDRRLIDYRPPGSLLASLDSQSQSFASIYRALSTARADDAVRGVVVTIRDARFGLATAQELRALLASLRQAGKFVECYLETAGEGSNGTLAYFLATACESVTLAPAGELNLIGLYADGVFLRGTLEKLRIDPYFSHVGDFKSAAEVFTEYGHSAAALEALSVLLDSYYSMVLEGIGISRNIGTDRLSGMVDGAPYSAEKALALGLVDHVAYPDEFRQRVEALTDRPLRRTPLGDYRAGSRPGSGPRLAVVFAQGSIVRGRGGSTGGPISDPSGRPTRWSSSSGSRKRKICAASSCGSTAPAAQPRHPTSSCVPSASWRSPRPSSYRWPTSPPPAATTSLPGRIGSSPLPPP